MGTHHYEHIKTWRRNHKKRLVEAFGGLCAICKVMDDPTIYDFHHLDPAEKDFTLSTKIMGWDKAAEEAKKCVMLCGNCHRKFHSSLVAIPDDAPRFDESRVGVTAIVTDKAKFDDCPTCGKPKLIGRKGCSKKCTLALLDRTGGSGRFQSKCPSDGELRWLAAEVKKVGYEVVRKRIGVSNQSLRTWLDSAGLGVRFRKTRNDKGKPKPRNSPHGPGG